MKIIRKICKTAHYIAKKEPFVDGPLDFNRQLLKVDQKGAGKKWVSLESQWTWFSSEVKKKLPPPGPVAVTTTFLKVNAIFETIFERKQSF